MDKYIGRCQLCRSETSATETVCPQCRADAELGRLVRGMPRGSHLANNLCGDPGEDWRSYDAGTGEFYWGATPEEALKGGKR